MNGGKTILASDFHPIDFPFLSTVRAEIIGRVAGSFWYRKSLLAHFRIEHGHISDRLSVYVHQWDHEWYASFKFVNWDWKASNEYVYMINVKKILLTNICLQLTYSFIYSNHYERSNYRLSRSDSLSLR